MNEQDKKLIESLAERIRNAPAPDIDREADALIRTSIGGRPDALYILTQTVLVQELALKQSQLQIDDLKKHASQTSSVQPAPGPSAQPVTPAAAPPAQFQPQVAPPGTGPLSGFLRSAASTAAGVIAGEAAFSALSGLFGHHFGSGPTGGFLNSVSGVSPNSETIINNYYGDQTERQDVDQPDESPAERDEGNDIENASSSTVDDSQTDDDGQDDDESSFDDAQDDSYDDGGDDSDL
jgi:hypothetical protein